MDKLKLEISIDKYPVEELPSLPNCPGIFFYYTDDELKYIGTTVNLRTKLTDANIPAKYQDVGFYSVSRKAALQPVYSLIYSNLSGLDPTKRIDTVVGRSTPKSDPVLVDNLRKLIKEGKGVITLGRSSFVVASDLVEPLKGTSTPFGSNHIGRALRVLGYKPVKKTVNRKVIRVWEKR